MRAFTGSFDHAHEFYLAARSQNGNVGYWIVTPLKTDSGETVLIERGWVPEEKKLPATRAAGQVAGTVTLNGFIRLPQGKTFFQPDNGMSCGRPHHEAPALLIRMSSSPSSRATLAMACSISCSDAVSQRNPIARRPKRLSVRAASWTHSST